MSVYFFFAFVSRFVYFFALFLLCFLPVCLLLSLVFFLVLVKCSFVFISFFFLPSFFFSSIHISLSFYLPLFRDPFLSCSFAPLLLSPLTLLAPNMQSVLQDKGLECTETRAECVWCSGRVLGLSGRGCGFLPFLGAALKYGQISRAIGRSARGGNTESRQSLLEPYV